METKKIPLEQFVFPREELLPVEFEELHKIFSNPIVIKYLRYLSATAATELITMGSLHTPDAEIANAHRRIDGQLDAYSTLLSISRS